MLSRNPIFGSSFPNVRRGNDGTLILDNRANWRKGSTYDLLNSDINKQNERKAPRELQRRNMNSRMMPLVHRVREGESGVAAT